MAFAFNNNGSKAEISAISEDFNRNNYLECLYSIQYGGITVGETMNIVARGNTVQVYLPLDQAGGKWPWSNWGDANDVIRFKTPYVPAKNYAILSVRGGQKSAVPLDPSQMKNTYKEIGTLWVQADGHTTLYLNGDWNYKRIYIEGTFIIN